MGRPTEKMSTETHDFTYSTSALGYMPECSCGWTGEEDWEDLDDAQFEWEDHTDDVFYRRPEKNHRTLVMINGVEHTWIDTGELSYDEVVRAAFPASSGVLWTVTWHIRGGNRGGELTRGEAVPLEHGMAFNVAHTGSA